MKPIRRVFTSKVGLRGDGAGVSILLVLILLVIGLAIGAVAATGGFSRIFGIPVPTDGPLGLDLNLARDIAGKALGTTSTSGPAGTPDSADTSASSTTTSPVTLPKEGEEPMPIDPLCCGRDIGLQAASPGPIDWAILAFLAILVLGVIAAKVKIRGPVFGIVVLVVIVLVVAAAVGTAVQGVDRDGDGDVDDARDVRTAGFSGTFVFDGTVAYTDGTSEDLHESTPLLAVARRGGKEVASLVLQVLLVHACDGCQARLTGGFVAFAASRPQGHAEGAFLKEGPRMDVPALGLRANESLELWRVAFDAARLQAAVADADGMGTYFLNLVGQVRLVIVNATGDPAPLVVDFAWPDMELKILDTTAPPDDRFIPPPPPWPCRYVKCLIPVSIVGGTNVKWWYLSTATVPEASSRAVLEDFGMI